MEIGRYKQLWSENLLTESHIEEVDGGLHIEGPSFTSQLTVNFEFLEARFGAWGADRAFTPDEGAAVFAGKKAEFVPLDINENSVFSWGNESQVRFLERPMWVSAVQDGFGGPITIEMQDGDITGQPIYVAKDWLWARGIHRPNATHEDGTTLNVTLSEDGRGFVIDIHHFSWITLSAQDITVKGYRNGQFVTHLGQVRFETSDKILEVDVPFQLLYDYEVWVERDWVAMNVPDPALLGRSWRVDSHQGMMFLVVAMPKAQTPATLIFQPFSPSLYNLPQFTAGSIESVYLFNDPLFLTMLLAPSGKVKVQTLLITDLGNHTSQIGFNYTFLAGAGIGHPDATTDLGPVSGYGSSAGIWQYRLPSEGLLEHLIADAVNPVFNLSSSSCVPADLGSATGKSFGPYNDEYPGHGSTVTVYVSELVWCWEWKMTLGPFMNSNQLKWYTALGGAFDSENPEIGCSMGNASTELVVNDEGAMTCTWPEEHDIADVLIVFYGTQVQKSEYDEVYSGNAHFGNCYTGHGGYFRVEGAPLVPWIVPVLVGVALAVVVTCAAMWLQKAWYAIWGDEYEARERLIVEDDISASSGLEIWIEDLNYGRWDTWNFIEDAALYTNPQRHGPQSLGWHVDDVRDAEGLYVPDISYVKQLGAYDTTKMRVVLHNGGQEVKFEANSGMTKFSRYIALNQVDWEAPEDLCAGSILITGTVNGILRYLHVGGVQSPSCPEVPPQIYWRIAAPQTLVDPWLEFEVVDTDLDTGLLLASTEAVSLQDVIDANGSVPLAMAYKMVADQEFLATLNITVPDGAFVGPDCGLLNAEYTATFTATTSGTSTIDNRPRNALDVLDGLVCFEHFYLAEALPDPS